MRSMGGILILFFSLTSFAAIAGNVDPAKWARLRVGMTESEVTSILGKPDRREQPARNRTTLTYGEIVQKNASFPEGLAYVIWLDENLKIDSLDSPFGDKAPRSGLPSKPDIFLPQQKSVFTHYPRIFDVRWYPATGTYPLSYEVQYEYLNKLGDGSWYLHKTLKTRVPHLSFEHGGSMPGRIRIRAINAEGTGPWSDYSVFEFTH